MQQEQLASLILAAFRSTPPADRVVLPMLSEAVPEGSVLASGEPVSWPEIPMSYVIISSVALAAVFFGGLSLAAQNRESKALAEMRHDAARWVYRMAA
jgi:hypothetical protein